MNVTILTAVTFDKRGRVALTEANRLAILQSAPLHVVHVVPKPLFHSDRVRLTRTGHELDEDELIEIARAKLHGFIHETLPDRAEAATLHIVEGTPYEGILNTIDQVKPSLVVLGGSRNQRAKLFGGTSERVIRHAPCTVLVARKSIAGTLLAAIDFSDPSMPSVTFAHDIARQFSLPLLVIHVIEVPPLMSFSPDGIIPPPVYTDVSREYRETIHAQLESCISQFQAQGIVREGVASHEIMRATKELRTSVLVIGTHGKTGWRRITLGSVAEEIHRNVKCSVFVVRLDRPTEGATDS